MSKQADMVERMGTLELHWQLAGPRYHLDGKPVHAGDILEAQLGDGSWIVVRFEYDWDPTENSIEPFLILSRREGESHCLPDVADTPCRWPQI